ncbi:Vacuolar protein sorting-associated protein 8 [Gaertneriomyces sp. JEL0708]|nr:Vacuolar protein sorting-associated protein 8 [Gaertneriomyces sp. JEL0708]
MDDVYDDDDDADILAETETDESLTQQRSFGWGSFRLPSWGRTSRALPRGPSAIQNLKETFSNLILEGDLAAVDQTTLRARIAELQRLQDEILPYMSSQSANAFEDARNLLERVVEEISVYGEFLDVPGMLRITVSGADDEGGKSVEGSQLLLHYEQFPEWQNIDTASEASSAHQLPPRPTSTTVTTLRAPRPRTHARSLSNSTATSIGSRFSTSSRFTASSRYSNSSTAVPPGPNDIFQWTPLKKIAARLNAAEVIEKYGVPTCVHVKGAVFVGMSKGSVWLWDLKQGRRGTLEPESRGVDVGAVTAIRVSVDRRTLLCGHANGAIRVWDVHRRVIVRSVPASTTAQSALSNGPEGHESNAAVIHLKSIAKGKGFVSGDDKMVVVALRPMRVVYRMKRNEVVGEKDRMKGETSSPGDTVNGDMSTQAGIVEEITACLAFSSPVNMSDSRAVLAVAFGKRVSVLSLRFDEQAVAKGDKQAENVKGKGEGVRFDVEWTREYEEDVCWIGWLEYKLLCCVTASLTAVLFDVGTGIELGRMPVGSGSPSLGVGSSQEPPLPPAAAVAGGSDAGIPPSDSDPTSTATPRSHPHLSLTLSLNPHLLASHSHLILLQLPATTTTSSTLPHALSPSSAAPSHIHVGVRLPWSTRLQSLFATGHFRTAVNLGIGFWSGTHRRLVTGLEAGKDTDAVRDRIVEMVKSYVEMSVRGEEDHTVSGTEESVVAGVYRELAELAVGALVTIGRMDVVFGDVYELFGSKGRVLRWAFFEVLVKFVAEGKVRELGPEMTKEFCEYLLWKERNKVKDERDSETKSLGAEEVLLRLELGAIDINYVLTMAKENGMWRVVWKVYETMGDVVGGVLELLNVAIHLQSPASSLSRPLQTESATSSLFTSLHAHLSPQTVPPSWVTGSFTTQVKAELWSLLLSPYHCRQYSSTASEVGDEPYPYLRALLLLDASYLLALLHSGLQDDTLDSSAIKLQKRIYTSVRSAKTQEDHDAVGGAVSTDPVVIDRQWIVDTLLETVEGPEPQVLDAKSGLRVGQEVVFTTDFGMEEVVRVYEYVARWYGMFPFSIGLKGEKVERILGLLIIAPVGYQSRTGDVGMEDGEARSSRQHALLAFLDAAVTFDDSTTRRFMVLAKEAGFQRVVEVLARRLCLYDEIFLSYLDEQHEQMRRAGVFDTVRGLVKEVKERVLLRKSIENVVQRLVNEMDDTQTVLLVNEIWPGEHPRMLQALAGDEKAVYEYLRAMSEVCLESVTSEMSVRFVELACRFSAGEVKPYLTRVDDRLAEGERERVLEVCRREGVWDAVVWVLERDGEWEEAMKVIGDALKSESGKTAEVDQVQNVMETGMTFCERWSGTSHGQVWVRLLDAVSEAMTTLEKQNDSAAAENETQAMKAFLAQTVHEILHLLPPHLPLHRVFELFMLHQPLPTSPPQKSHPLPLSQARPLLNSLLSHHTYTTTLLSVVTRIAQHDVHTLQERDVHTRAKGIRPKHGVCRRCGRLVHVKVVEGKVWVGKSGCLCEKCRGECGVGRDKRARRKGKEREGEDPTDGGTQKTASGHVAMAVTPTGDEKLMEQMTHADRFRQISSRVSTYDLFQRLSHSNGHAHAESDVDGDVIDYGDSRKRILRPRRSAGSI